jgi:hypothetical protein
MRSSIIVISGFAGFDWGGRGREEGERERERKIERGRRDGRREGRKRGNGVEEGGIDGKGLCGWGGMRWV